MAVGSGQAPAGQSGATAAKPGGSS
jgi:hypothetical protein